MLVVSSCISWILIMKWTQSLIVLSLTLSMVVIGRIAWSRRSCWVSVVSWLWRNLVLRRRFIIAMRVMLLSATCSVSAITSKRMVWTSTRLLSWFALLLSIQFILQYQPVTTTSTRLSSVSIWVAIHSVLVFHGMSSLAWVVRMQTITTSVSVFLLLHATLVRMLMV